MKSALAYYSDSLFSCQRPIATAIPALFCERIVVHTTGGTGKSDDLVVLIAFN